MLIKNQNFTIKINKKNINWYQSKGYDCNLRDEIIINIEDLILNSHIVVFYKCDRCGKDKPVKFSDFNKRHNINEKTYCKQCADKIRIENYDNTYLAKDGFKVCTKCKRKLPSDKDHFTINNESKDNLLSKCKECCGFKFTEHLTKIPRNGYKFCIKCNRELLIDEKYFPIDKNCKDGLRNVCRECNNNKFLSDVYIPNECWTKEEENILIDNYKKYTNDELIKLFFSNKKKKSIIDKAYRIGIMGKDRDVIMRGHKVRVEKLTGENSPLFGVPMKEESKIKLSNSLKEYYKYNHGWWLGKKRSEKQKQMIGKRMKGIWAGNKNPRYKNPLRG